MSVQPHDVRTRIMLPLFDDAAHVILGLAPPPGFGPFDDDCGRPGRPP